jgi:hypothetical protein
MHFQLQLLINSVRWFCQIAVRTPARQMTGGGKPAPIHNSNFAALTVESDAPIRKV